jgi:hemoglobin
MQDPRTTRRCALLLALALCACARGGGEQEPETFTTSGSREADQRAEQRMSKQDELQGADGASAAPEARPTLYQRLGEQAGVQAIVADYVQRALADPRVNWNRKGVKSGGFLRLRRRSAEWAPTEQDIAQLELHLAQFIAVASGGPSLYEGRNLEVVHEKLAISNAEFDASIGALKASLDALKIGTDEQKELLAIFESGRSQVVRKR